MEEVIQLVTAAGVPWSWFGVLYRCRTEVDKHCSFFLYVWISVQAMFPTTSDTC